MSSLAACASSLILLAALLMPAASLAQDPRNIENGHEIPSMGYADMPMVCMLSDGSWLCVLTTGPGEEGRPGQTVACTRSTDRGKTWSELVLIEPSADEAGRESSWGVPLHVAHQGSDEYGRVYVFYVHNIHGITDVPSSHPDVRHRVDMLGGLFSRYSDDAGRTWSDRIRIPIPITRNDARNTFNGEIQMFWISGKPVVSQSDVLLPFTKIRHHLLGHTEGWVLASGNFLTEADPSKHDWQLLPMGNSGPTESWHGLRSETHFAGAQAEHVLTKMQSPGHLMMLCRTDVGLVSVSWSSDNGRTWTEPEPARYADETLIRNPRANVKAWSIGDDRYLLWFHNNRETDIYDRNPAWLSAGVEHKGRIRWSQPEIVLYHPDPDARISYPDLIMDGERLFLTETQKSVARVHEIDSSLIDGLFAQIDEEVDMPEGALTWRSDAIRIDLAGGEGCSIAIFLKDAVLYPGVHLSRAPGGTRTEADWYVRPTEDGALEIVFEQGGETFRWASAPIDSYEKDVHCVVFTLDAQAGILSVVANSKLQDGGDKQQFGWTRLPDWLEAIDIEVRSAPGCLVFPRSLTTSEAVELCASRWEIVSGPSPDPPHGPEP